MPTPRAPCPLGYCTRWMDGRVADPNGRLDIVTANIGEANAVRSIGSTPSVGEGILSLDHGPLPSTPPPA